MSAAQVDQLPQGIQGKEEKKGKSWSESAKQTYHEQYDRWVPWLEDLYLRWFTKDNKASYTAKDTLSKTKVTGIQQVDTLQDGVHDLAAGQVGQGGLGQPVGDAFSKEGLNRFERKGRDENGEYAPGPGAKVVDGVVEGSKSVGAELAEGGKNLGESVGGLLGRK
ncbi:hypothetical protein NKR23_g10747 [Pleurostoma richardsiae]|uniref:Uncharacterized protein n=1 Tax=Pleurostoma richardsiae TaxID=41990 RepID=A0AA38R9C9_9PEZI|nr:hypothetical protein NKR23_g10747 [Pleurostoma richardsiae]